MYWVDVEGYRMPNLFGGDRALELCNTRAAWDRPWEERWDYLGDYDRLAVWSRHVDLLTDDQVRRIRDAADRNPPAAARVLTRVRRLREALYRVLTGTDPDAFAVVARHAQRAAATARLEPAEVGATWTLAPESGTELPLHAAAGAAATLLTSPRVGQVRACPGDDCGWLFLDARGRRRWCSMATCGNRAKVRSFAARRHRDPA